MKNPSIECFEHTRLEDILRTNEVLLWSGCPAYGSSFFQAVGEEKKLHIGLLVGVLAMWGVIPFIEDETRFDRIDALMIFSVATVVFAGISFSAASQRQYVLFNLVYFVTNKRSIVCRKGRNWRLSTRLYVVSCPHSATYPYRIINTRPHPSLQIGTLLSQDQLQPFGLGLTHPGQPHLWGRVTSPIVFEYIPNATELLEVIERHAASSTAV